MDPSPPALSDLPLTELVGTLEHYAVFTIDKAGIILSWNAGVRRLLGYESHEFIGQHVEIIFTLEGRAYHAVESEMRRARVTSDAKDDRWHLRKDGSRIWVNGIMHAVRDESGELLGYLKIMRDRTSQLHSQKLLEESEERFQTAFKANPVPTAILRRPDGWIVEVNAAFTRAFRLERHGAIGRTVADIDIVPAGEQLARILSGVEHGDRLSFEAPFCRAGAAPGYGVFTLAPIDLGGDPHMLLLLQDITELHAANEALERQAQEESALAQISSATIAGIELPAILELAVRSVAATLPADSVRILEAREGGGVDVRAEYPTAATPAPALPFPLRDDLPQDGGGRLTQGELASSGFASGIYYPIRGYKHSYGVITALAVRSAAFTGPDERLLQSVALLLAGAIEQQRLNHELAYRAEHDDLTGLPTRTMFERHLHAVLEQAKRRETMLAVLFLDLDRFKLINDSLGHQAGDEVLRSVAKRVVGTLRPQDMVARHGGDEFVMLLPEVESGTEVAHIAARLVKTFGPPFAVGGHELKVSTTIGIATYPDDGQDAETLLRAADTALYEGKSRGRSSFRFFTKEQGKRVTERLELEADLRRALEAGSFDLVYQPRIDLVRGRPTSVEALVRWQHPTAGPLLPGAFMPVAAAIGLSVPLGELVLRKAFAQYAAWRGQPDAPQRVAVNVAALHVMQPAFPEVLADLFREAGIGPSEVEIEISADTLLRDEEMIAANLHGLRELGVRSLVSDFGTNAAPLARLWSLPIAGIKVDAVFTAQLGEPHGRQLVEAFVHLAKSLEVEAIAEAVESRVQDEAVRELGFGAAQGNWYSPPLEAARLLDYFAASAGKRRS